MYESSEIVDFCEVLKNNETYDYNDPAANFMDKKENSPISGRIKIISCNANKVLAADIAKRLGSRVSDSETGKFEDGEIFVKINETIRGADVYIVQPTCPPVNDNLMELLIMIDAMRRASAGHINVVMPYFGYARQDRKARARDPISAKLVANLITTAGADRVITMDLHCPQIQGFFDIPLDHLLGFPVLTKYYQELLADCLSDTVVISPDLGSIPRARAFAERLNVKLAIIDKRRPKPNESKVINIIGDIVGKKVIIADDMIDTAGTLTNAAEALHQYGAAEIYACCTHAVLSGKAIERIQKSVIKEIVALNTVPLSDSKKTDKLKILSVADIFAEAIWRIHNGESVSTLFV